MVEYLLASLTLLVLAFVQTTAFSIVSRSRNRSSMKFHLTAALFSNTIWFLTFRLLVKSAMSMGLFPWYCIGTMCGSVFGVRISMYIERKLGATADSENRDKVAALEGRIEKLEKIIEN